MLAINMDTHPGHIVDQRLHIPVVDHVVVHLVESPERPSYAHEGIALLVRATQAFQSKLYHPLCANISVVPFVSQAEVEPTMHITTT